MNINTFILMTVMVFVCANAQAEAKPSDTLRTSLATLENSFDGKVGVYAIDTNNHHVLAYRADERFPMQSTVKLIGVAALLQQSLADKKLLKERIYYADSDLHSWHPITGLHVKSGMMLEALSAAAVSYSDNPAINLIFKRLGGPVSVTAFAHSIGNESFNLVHYEGQLNSNPNYADDTVTPKDMAISVKQLTLGNVLPEPLRAKLLTWMKDSTTSYKRMRYGVPITFTVADKTGSGDYGVANDVGVVWSPVCKPIVIAIYTAGNKQAAKSRDDIIATTTQIVLDELGKKDACLHAIS